MQKEMTLLIQCCYAPKTNYTLFLMTQSRRTLNNLIGTGRILIRVGLLVVEELDEAVVARCEQTAEKRPHPVNPMGSVKGCCSDTGSKRACRIETTASVVNTLEKMLVSVD
jgi:hypothetical protein